MRRRTRTLAIAPALLLAASCAKGEQLSDGGPVGPTADASCGDLCDQDGDGVPDPKDLCPNTPQGAVVNSVGCADSQLTTMLGPPFPPYGLSWTSAGDIGSAGGLTWTYTNITRGDLFHIYWIICDDPSTPCGLSLDGPIDAPGESWTFDAVDSAPGSGTLVFTNATHILLADSTTPALTGRLTMTIADGDGTGTGSGSGSSALAFADVGTLDVTARLGQYGAEILGTSFVVTAIEEVQPVGSGTWTPYEDYYNAASTPGPGSGSGSGSAGAYSSFGGSFYDK